MKSNPSSISDDNDDIFGPPRTHPTGYCPPKSRFSMISPKYRQKEERRKILKISILKLKKIEDPETSLCRSVLINNTVKKLQKETRQEKIAKQKMNYPKNYDNYLNLKSEFMKNELRNDFTTSEFESGRYGPDSNEIFRDFCDGDKTNDDNFEKCTKNVDFITNFNNSDDNSDAFTNTSVVDFNDNADNKTTVKNMDSFDSFDDNSDKVDILDAECCLSQFYMPPTPRLLTSIDEDDLINVEDDGPPPAKRQKIEINENYENNSPSMECLNSLTDYSHIILKNKNSQNLDQNNSKNKINFAFADEPSSSENIIVNNNTDSECKLANNYSCGHSSLFSDMQNNVFHNLIASLET